MKMPKTDIPNAQNDRKKRLADALRKNLQLRKARAKAGDDKSGADKPAQENDKS
ncbi:MAG: hypothetical protein ACRCU5_00950 [Rhizobiaceae bacterium]